MILGTAGHIDHGKTALVRALTGVDTDRLPEEKRRGITIELGFAPLTLDGIGVVGVVDVPGHEGFVRTMLAGATGVDLALLVIAADEGVMPQTREHLAILDLLGVRAGVITLTKRDLVEDEGWLELVAEDVRSLVAGTALEGAPVIATSATTGEGLDELRRALADAARTIPARSERDLFRMPVDRAFTVRGTGTVATGTVWTGMVRREDSVSVWPSGRTVRVRGIQAHGVSVDRATSGSRAAVALAAVELDEVARGATLVGGEGWSATTILRAEVELLDDVARPLGPRTRVRFHLGTLDVGARVIAAGGALAPGERRAARLVLDAPVVARAGDRFVLRAASPTATIGGGVVVDPAPPRRARPWPMGLGAAERTQLVVEEAGTEGVGLSSLPVRVGVAPDSVAGLVAELGDGVRRLGERLLSARVLDELADRASEALEEFHRQQPLEPGLPLQLLRSRLGAAPEVVDAVLERQVRAGRLVLAGALVRAASWAPQLSTAEQVLAESLVAELGAAGAEPASVAELVSRHGAQTVGLLRYLERQSRLVQVESERYYERDALETLLDRLRKHMDGGSEHSPAELREVLGVSRKYLIPLLEFCDRVGYTARLASGGRVWRGHRLGSHSRVTS